MSNRRRPNLARAAAREARNLAVNALAPRLVRPVFVGVDASAWTDLEPAQYPPDTVEFVRLALSAGEDRRTLDGFLCDTCHGVTITSDRHPGFHPRYVDHTAFGSRCPGLTKSLGYPAEDLPPGAVASHEWYRPAEDELLSLADPFVHHVLEGGLIMRVVPA